MMQVANRLVKDDQEDAQRVISEHINYLLAQWHSWSAGHQITHGYPTINTTCRQARSSRQYDDANGALDAYIDHVVMEAVDGVIETVSEPYRSALSVQARNLHTGAQVWNSPRLPADPVQRGHVVVKAREMFVSGLTRRNLL